MIKLGWDKNFNLQISCQLQLPVKAEDKLEIGSAFSVLYQKYEQFSKWFDNPDTPPEQAEPFKMCSYNGKAGCTFMRAFMHCCGFTDMEILEFVQLPF